MKILGLPFLPQQHVLLQLDPQEVVLLSFCSAKMRKTVVEVLRRELSVLELEYTTKGKLIRLNRKTDKTFMWWLLNRARLSREERRSSKEFSIQNASDTHHCSIYEGKPGFLVCKINLQDVSRMIEYLQGLFHIAPLKLNIDPAIITNMNAFLSNPVYQDLETFQLSGNYINGKKMASIFDSMPVLNRAIVMTKKVHGTVDKQCKLFKANNVFIKDAHWLTREHLLSFDSLEKAIFMNVELKTDDLIAFVKHWRDSGNTKTKALAFYKNRSAQSEHWDMDAIVMEMGAQPWNRAQRRRYFKFDRELIDHCNEAAGGVPKRGQNDYTCLEQGLDFERSDGLLASIFGNCRMVGLFVWHDRFPQYPYDWPE